MRLLVLAPEGPRFERAQVGDDCRDVVVADVAVERIAHRRLVGLALAVGARADRVRDLRIRPVPQAGFVRRQVARDAGAPFAGEDAAAGAQPRAVQAPLRVLRRVAFHAVRDLHQVLAIAHLVRGSGARLALRTGGP